MIYGLIRLELDDFSGLDTRWVPDLGSLRTFYTERDRDMLLSELEEDCECYEDYVPLDIVPMKHDDFVRERFGLPPQYPRDEKGRFKKYKYENQERKG